MGTIAKRRRGITKSARRSLPRCVHSTTSAASEWMDYPEIVSLFREKGAEGINPLLRREEQEELFETVDPYRMVELVLEGMSRF